MIKITLLVCAVLVPLASSAAEQNAKSDGPCTADELKLCGGIKPGRENLRACFREHIHELSDSCLLAVARFTAVDKTCRNRLAEACARFEPGQGLLEACLRSEAAKLDDYCKNALSRAIPGAVGRKR
jgi:hypothetical protein